MAATLAELTGLDDGHIEYDAEGVGMAPACRAAFQRLREDAAEAGFDLCVASGFRNFERQLLIWNAKAGGERPVFDDSGVALDLDALDDMGKVHAILRHSALPGGSRHHWGSDIDIYDAAAMPAGYQLQLTLAEAADDGLFGRLHRWLDERMAAGEAQGFFRPYARDDGGVAPEPWHLSFAPLAETLSGQYRLEHLREALEGADMALSAVVLRELPALYRRYVENVHLHLSAPGGLG